MAEPTIPAAVTIAVLVMTVTSWYGMLRAGVQLVHDDMESRRSAEEDILDMLVDLEHQQISFTDWKRTWLISERTSETVLLQFWGGTRLNIIKQKLKRIGSDLEKAREKLGRLAEMKSGDWADMNKLRRSIYKTKFISYQQKYVRDLINRWPNNMTVIRDESKAGWDEQLQSVYREIELITPYHTQAAHLLVQIAMQNLKDAEALRTCCQVVRDDVAIFLDLDLFDAFAAVTEAEHVERIEQVLQAGHLKLELLLREANRQEAELTRVVVERVSNRATPESRMVDAFRAILSTLDCTPYFAPNTSTLFSLSKCRRAGDPCSTLQQSFREVLADQDPPTYDALTGQFLNHGAVLGEVSNARAASELAQACLLFLRTDWIRGLCRCTVRCGVLPNVPAAKRHQFGLELVETTHQIPLWRDPHEPGQYVEGSPEHSWCTTDYRWYGLNKPIRHLGLLLVELSLRTIVFPVTCDNTDGAAPVAEIHILVKAEPGPWKWECLSLGAVLNLVKQSFNNSELVAGAVEHCPTEPFPSSPSVEMEKDLRGFYFRVVKPYVLPP